MTRLYAVPVGALALALCTAVERTALLANVRVDVCGMLVAYLAFRFDVVGGAVTALVLGLLLDATSGAPTGLHMFSLATVFVVTRVVANAFQVQPGVRVAPVAVGAAAGHLLLVGQVIVGAVLSTLVTVKVQVLVRPLMSVTVRVTVMLPAPETVVPASGDCVTLCTPQLSPVVAKLV